VSPSRPCALLRHQQQYLALSSLCGAGHDVVGWIAARQIGKTTANRVLSPMLASRNAWNDNARDVTVFSVNLDESLDFTDRVTELLGAQFPGRRFSKKNIKVPGGYRIKPKAATPAAARGPSGHIIFDELDYYVDPELVYFEALAIASKGLARVHITTTPAYEGSFCYRLLTDPAMGAGIRWFSTTVYDAIDNGLETDVARLERMFPDPEIFASRFLCHFLSTVGLWFNLDLVRESPRRWKRVEGAEIERKYGGIDVSRGGDLTVFTEIRQSNGRFYAQKPPPEYVFRTRSTAEIMKRAEEFVAEGDFAAVGVDASEPSYYLYEHLERLFPGLIVGLRPVQNAQTKWASRLRGSIEDGTFVLYSDRDLLDDFRKVRRNQAGKVKTERTKTGHADVLWSLIHAHEAATDAGDGVIVDAYTGWHDVTRQRPDYARRF